ncbi:MULTISPECIES: asparaginase [unclassified Modestobacter]|uniref:asparaginase n=1 Tax=unclassified Modestobacter TaxID=2643866 RepID=UPI0022AB11B9|nr:MULTISPECIES: asparaginase [unclassified Modestobacter]MCZ2826186.1 asparaginase [Modestobacter sp. VKM Ac-2981]MCZ2852749.1 asparaginase [Modestobacter sp. VKM Ac-2982]
MHRVHLLATGGTIASRQGPDGLAAVTPAAELLAAADSPAGLTVTTSDLGTVASFALTTADLRELVAAARGCLGEGVDGVVVTHGTDTLEESAYLADLVHDDPRPIVFTGAQRPFDSPAPDGPANLADALRVAAAPAARNLGVLVCFDGLAFAARGVRKVDTLRSGAFGAPGRGPVLRLAGESVRPLARPERPAPLPLDLRAELPRVDVIACHLGVDAALVRAAVAAGAAGLVLQGLGAGNVPPAVAEATEDLVAGGIPVLVCSRVPSGPVAPIYAAGGARLARGGAVFAGDLSPWQGRLLLAAALAVAPDDPLRVLAQHLAV